MFYKLIEKKRNEWLASSDCTVSSLLSYIEQRGMMRDAQVEAIKTYLFLKIACQGKPLWQLFSEGRFNDTDLQEEKLTVETRRVLTTDPAALALFQYSRLQNKNGKQLAPQLEEFMHSHAREVDYKQAFRDIFYDITYADYLFSLPMGAGKTFLMAAFIYIDLYFAENEPSNPIWAHNFLILAPSGLKSSIIPSLRSIRAFDPSWIFPEETAIRLRRLIHFEVLDEQKSGSKSNIVRNPNAHKLNMHLADGDCMGLVAVTNAEKVILDRLDKKAAEYHISEGSQLTDEEKKKLKEEWKKIDSANELRTIIGRMPHLAVFIDEVHHATDSDIKLRQVVTGWAEESHSFTNVLGFSGTPYLEKAEKIVLGGQFEIKNTDISNVVYFYPLIEGIDNFLKHPTVKHADSDRNTIIKEGICEFFDTYKDTVYADGACAKIAIYCGTIPTLEEEIYPLVAEMVTAYGMSPTDVILKRHKGNKQYPEPKDSEAAFAQLDTSFSKVRILLLVQIGKEGWDCRSLTGIILPHEGACPKNMVLQTSCRCLRHTQRGARESALIWMNKWNADKLNKELQQQQNITLRDFAHKPDKPATTFNRYNRMEKHHTVPPIQFYQIKVEYQTVIIEDQPDTHARLTDPAILARSEDTLVYVQDMTGKDIDFDVIRNEDCETLSYTHWLRKIQRESMGTLTMACMKEYDAELHAIYEQITIPSEGVEQLPTENSDYDHQRIRSLIRKAFVPKRDFRIKEELVSDKASLLSVKGFQPQFSVADPSRVYPSATVVSEIIEWDEHPEKGHVPAEKLAMLEQMKAMPGMTPEMLQTVEQGIMAGVETDPHPERLQTYQYLPYKFDSQLEVGYFSGCLISLLKDTDLEYYFNGDDNLTEFKIRCYKKHGSHWQYDGLYVPDFIILSRDAEGDIDRICIIETKGEGYADKFADRLSFIQDTFVPKNNDAFGCERFKFLYLKETETVEQRILKTKNIINDFFKA